MIISVSFTASGSVRARVTVVQSSSRTLIATVRPRIPFLRIPSASSAASRASTASSSAWSAMSRSNVVSLERDFAGPRSASTTSEPWKCARACRSRPWRPPKRRASVLGIGLLDARRSS